MNFFFATIFFAANLSPQISFAVKYVRHKISAAGGKSVANNLAAKILWAKFFEAKLFGAKIREAKIFGAKVTGPILKQSTH